MRRRELLALAALAPLGFARAARAAELTDILGHKLTLAAPARRIVLAEARQLAVLGLIHPDPVSLVVGWRETRGLDPVTRAAWAARFPQLDQIATIGIADRLTPEAILALRPDLVILTAEDSLADPGLAPRLGALGLAVLHVDFFARPAQNTVTSLRLLGEALGRREAATALAYLWQSRLDAISARLAPVPEQDRPKVFIHAHAGGTDCCASAVDGIFDDFIYLAGGRNLAREAASVQIATLRAEWLLMNQPDVYLATGGAHLAAAGGLVIGPGVSPETVGESFGRMIARAKLTPLAALHEGRAHAVWHLFNDTPANIALIEYLAKALHPALFADLDPVSTLREIMALAPVAPEGSYFQPVQPA